MINSLVDWLVQAIDSFGYLGVLIAVFLESFTAVIPSQIVLPFSGFVASQGSLNIVLVIITVTIGAYLGTLPFYFIGRWGDDFVGKFLTKYGKYIFLSNEDLEKGYKAFEKYGGGIVLFGRLIPLIRSVISFPAGVARMKFSVFSLYTVVGSLIFATVSCLAGYFMGENWPVVSSYIDQYENIVLALLSIAILIYIWKGMREVIKKSKEEVEKEA
ncbi:MAG TPA: DedA family protein [Candidatus Dojkabacteria bacterium]|nr:DedA family protein [Candidatus Dojkabacteria bacterium]